MYNPRALALALLSVALVDGQQEEDVGVTTRTNFETASLFLSTSVRGIGFGASIIPSTLPTISTVEPILPTILSSPSFRVVNISTSVQSVDDAASILPSTEIVVSTSIPPTATAVLTDLPTISTIETILPPILSSTSFTIATLPISVPAQDDATRITNTLESSTLSIPLYPYSPATNLPTSFPPVTSLPPAYSPIPPELASLTVLPIIGGPPETLTLVPCSAISTASGVTLADYEYTPTASGALPVRQPNIFSDTNGNCAFLPTPSFSPQSSSSSSTIPPPSTLTTLPPAYSPIPAESARLTTVSRARGPPAVYTLVDCDLLTKSAAGVNISDYRYTINGQKYQKPNLYFDGEGNCAYLPTPTRTAAADFGTGGVNTVVVSTATAGMGNSSSSGGVEPFVGGAAAVGGKAVIGLVGVVGGVLAVAVML
ncbi:hypothetical protein B0A50_05849 [Salinomyces thailandicus]|uniref:Uncharacterized protein n=1 Tax=Salinomyces thailandicus TaxID=706561 RepID=A0A4U0TUV2_9PEZI|nr:hypothetical protein B0A50_05849 [Salinomyces thailandica]